jgi:DNA mismatch repair protein MutL
MENDGGSSWHIKALPAGWKKTDDETIAAILALQNAKENLAENWAAALACHAAIKDGDYLDNESAFALAESVLSLTGEGGQIPRCPHGRPLWVELSKEDLFRAVRRKE